MATLTKTIAAFALAITTLSTSASADTYRHIDQLALQIERQSKLIVSETRHYRHTPEYRHLVSDARDMCRLTSHLHEVAHHHGSLAHLESDVEQLDAKFHHLESVFDRVERHAAHGHGHIHGNTSHVKELLNSIEDSIHHLQADLRSLCTPVHSTRSVFVPRTTIYRTPYSGHWGGYNSHGWNSPHRSYSRGITFGGGSSRFTIRF